MHELLIAERNIAIEGFDTSAFLAQQAVEKTMKAVCALRGRKPPRTHNLDELAAVVALPSDLVELAYDLAGDYVFARHPDVADHVPYEEYTREIALEKVEQAKRLIEYLRDTNPELQELLDA